METIRIKVDGMTCGGCTGSLEKLLLNEPGIDAANASHEDNVCELTLDPQAVSMDRVGEIVDAAGFEYGGEDDTK